MVACGSSGDSGESGGSGSSGASESAEPEQAEATGEDYAALFSALFEQQGKVKEPKTAEEFNEQASFPEGITVGEFDPKAQSLCIQDEGKDISGTFNVAGDVGIILEDGVCGKGEEVSKLVPDPKDQGKILVEGDKEIGQPVVDVFETQSGGSGS